MTFIYYIYYHKYPITSIVSFMCEEQQVDVAADRLVSVLSIFPPTPSSMYDEFL